MIDVSEIKELALDMARMSNDVAKLMIKANQDVLKQGVVFMKNSVPVRYGGLKGSVIITAPATLTGGAFGATAPYAWQRDVGGTIYGRPFLVWRSPTGQLIFARKVTQSGSFYSAKTETLLSDYSLVRYNQLLDELAAYL